MSKREEQVYVVSAEVVPQEGSEMWGVAIGGFVNCYVKAEDARQASSRVASALGEDKYGIVAFEWIMPAADIAWDDDDVEEQRAYEETAGAGDDVVYSQFNTYEAQHEH